MDSVITLVCFSLKTFTSHIRIYQTKPLTPSPPLGRPDHETALSAVRNLREVPVSGRTLRVELSTDEPIPRKRTDGRPSDRVVGGSGGVRGTPAGLPPAAGGGGGAGGGPVGGRYMDDRERGPPPPSSMGGGINLGALPPGQDVPPGVKATDQISKTLASIPPGKLEEVLMQMKVSKEGVMQMDGRNNKR